MIRTWLEGAQGGPPQDESRPSNGRSMAANHDDRVNDTLWLGALLLLLSQYFWQFLEAWKRGLLVPWLASLAVLLASASMGLLGFGRPRAHLDRAILWAAGVLLAGTVAWHLVPVAGPAMKEPGRRETARLLLNRYLLAVVTLGSMLAVARLAGRAAAAAPRPRIAPAALLVIAGFAVSALFVIAAARRSGVGPVGPAAALLFMVVALATAVVVHRLPPRHDA